jgi:hypothetical protein
MVPPYILLSWWPGTQELCTSVQSYMNSVTCKTNNSDNVRNISQFYNQLCNLISISTVSYMGKNFVCDCFDFSSFHKANANELIRKLISLQFFSHHLHSHLHLMAKKGRIY